MRPSQPKKSLLGAHPTYQLLPLTSPCGKLRSASPPPPREQFTASASGPRPSAADFGKRARLPGLRDRMDGNILRGQPRRAPAWRPTRCSVGLAVQQMLPAHQTSHPLSLDLRPAGLKLLEGKSWLQCDPGPTLRASPRRATQLAPPRSEGRQSRCLRQIG